MIQDIELFIEEPGLVCIIGPNGVGKFTFLKCLNKILRPSEGMSIWGGYDLADLTLKDISVAVGHMPVDTKDGFSMTVLETVLLGRHPRQRFGTTSDYDLRIVHRVPNMMGIRELAICRFDELSAGQRQKVCIAKEIAQTSVPPGAGHSAPQGPGGQGGDDRGDDQPRSEHRFEAYGQEILMAPPGVIYGCGPPDEVVTEDSIEDMYKAECRIIDDRGHPHAILGDPLE